MQGALIQTAALTLLHFLWEGLLIGLVAAVALRSAAGRTAQRRHLICMVALVCCLLGPVITAAVVAPPASLAFGLTAPSSLAAMPLAGAHGHPASRFVKLSLGPPVGPMYAAVLLWLAGALCVTTYYIAQWVGVQRVRHGAFALQAPEALVQSAHAVLARWRETAQVVVMVSHTLLSPIVVGVWRPVIIFPAALLARMSVGDFELILLHEAAHIVRRDAWANALQIALEILLFYHPVVHWLSRRARLERECACDDFAVSASGTRYEYARALAGLAFHPVAPVSLGAAGGELLQRLRHLGGQSAEAEAFHRSPVHLLLLAALLACLLVLRQPWPQLRGGLTLHGSHEAVLARPAAVIVSPSASAARSAPAATALAPQAQTGERPASRRTARARDLEAGRAEVAWAGAGAMTLAPHGTAGAPLLQPVPRAAAATAVAAEPALLPDRAAAQSESGIASPKAVAEAPPVSTGSEPAPVLTPIYDPAPEYPLQARIAGLQGSVLVVLRVGADGRPSGLQIVKASPLGVFEGAVRRALMHWRYRVADGDATQLTAAYRLTFSLAGVSSTPASVCATATASRTCEQP